MRHNHWIPALFLAAAAAVIAAAVLLSERRGAQDEAAYLPMEPMRVAVAADLHYLSPALTDGGSLFTRVITNSDGKLMQYSEELAEALVAVGLSVPVTRHHPDKPWIVCVAQK
jgi:hypothetical protein